MPQISLQSRSMIFEASKQIYQHIFADKMQRSSGVIDQYEITLTHLSSNDAAVRRRTSHWLIKHWLNWAHLDTIKKYQWYLSQNVTFFVLCNR